jgi:hypothetical protein
MNALIEGEALTPLGGMRGAWAPRSGYLLAEVASPMADWPAARRAVGTRNGEHET